MKKPLLLFACLLSSFFSIAQINYGGEPLSWTLNMELEIPTQRMPSLDIKTLSSEDKVNDQIKESPYRFGKDHEVSLNFFDEAVVTNSQNNSIYQMAIDCPDALSVSFLFSAFYIPEGASLFVYNEDRTMLKGAFTSKSNKDSGVFPVGIIKDNKVILEYNGPIDGAILHISEVTHGYRAMLNKWEPGAVARGPFGDADECHININCDEGTPWQDQKRSVVLITEGGDNHCSGAIVNNTLQDGTPYLLTANHCLGDPTGWVFYFNHESPTCDGNTGPIDQSIAGSTLRANRLLSDFALIELSEAIPDDYNVYYAGWDHSDETTVTKAVSIHHPSGDVKKISIDEEAPNPNLNILNYEVWSLQWDSGVTEGGSSGSPLFDQNGRIIGQLNGGQASCNGTFPGGYSDHYGRFGVSWDGTSAATRLKDWLDPNNSGVVVLNGYGPNDTTYALNVVNVSIGQIPKVVCTNDPFTPSFTFKNNGSSEITSATIQTTIDGVVQPDINWTGSLAQHALETIQLAEVTPSPGTDIDIEVTTTNINGSLDENPDDNTITSTVKLPISATTDSDVTVSIYTDDYGYETSWRVIDVDNNEIIAGGLFSSYDDFTTYTDVINFPSDGCYAWNLYDNYGDGICCGQGEGSYTLTDEEGNILATGGEFGGKEIIVLEKISDVVSTETINSSNIVEVFPNPTDGIININILSTSDQFNLRLLNPLGQVIKTDNNKVKTSTTLDISDLPKGTYFLEVSTNGSKSFHKIILN